MRSCFWLFLCFSLSCSQFVGWTQAAPKDVFEGASPAFDAAKPEKRILNVGAWGVAEQTGAATYTYPIELPDGRNGMRPTLAFRYSSLSPIRGGIAVGWTLDIPSIRIDRALGQTKAPQYRASLNGITGRLVEVPDDAPKYSNLTKAYRVEFDGTFTRFFHVPQHQCPVGFDCRPNGWVALTADGVEHHFEETDLPTTLSETRWQITRQVDSFGNTVDYFWTPVFEGDAQNGRMIDISLDRIEYSSNPGANLRPHVRVKFEYFPEIETCFGSKVPIGAAFRNNFGKPILGYYEGARRLTAISIFVKDNQESNWVFRRRISLRYNLDIPGPSIAKCVAMTQGLALHRRFRYLTQIQETATSPEGKETQLPAVQFDYSRRDRILHLTTKHEIQRGFDHFGGKGGAQASLIDVNGDGMSDRVTVSSQSGDCVLSWQKSRFGGSVESARRSLWEIKSLPGCSVNGGFRITDLNGPQALWEQISLHFFDFNADGTADLLTNTWSARQTSGSVGPDKPLRPEVNDSRYIWRLHTNNGASLGFPFKLASPSITGITTRHFPPSLPPTTGEERIDQTRKPLTSIPLFADLDGDGSLDFIDVGTHPRLLGRGKWSVSFHKKSVPGGVGYERPQDWIVPNVELASAERGFFIEKQGTLHENKIIVAGLHDINGDGLLDLVVQAADEKLISHINFGNGFLQTPIELGLSVPLEEIQSNFKDPGLGNTITDGDRGYRRRMIDIDGDGLVDMLVFPGPKTDIAQTSGQPQVHLNFGDRFSPPIPLPEVWSKAKRLIHAEDGNWSLRGDMLDGDGDHLLDIVAWSGDGKIEIHTDSEITSANRALTRIDNGRGLRIRYRYGPTTDPEVMDPSGGARLPRPLWPVRAVEVSTSIGGATETIKRFTYRMPAFLPPSGHANDGRPPQFLGFREVTTTTSGTTGEDRKNRIRREYAYGDNGHPEGRVVKEWIFEGIGNELQIHSYRENAWRQKPLFQGQTFFTHLDSSMTRTCIANATEAKCMTQAENLYRTEEVWEPVSPSPFFPPVVIPIDPDFVTLPKLYVRKEVQEGEGFNEGPLDRRTSFKYQIRYGQTIDRFGQPLWRSDDYRVLITETKREAAKTTDSGLMFETIGLTNTSFERITGLPKRTDRHIDSSRTATTIWQFDPQTGNLIAKTKPEQSSPNGTGNKAIFEYDPHNVFVKKTINELGHETATVVDVATGSLLDRKGPNFRILSSGEVVWERETWRIDAFGRVEEHAISMDDDSAGYTLHTVERIDNPDSQQPNRIHEERLIDFGINVWLTTDYAVDGQGRLLSKTIDLDSGPDAVTSYRYDALGNLDAIEVPDPRLDGAQVRYDYQYDGLNRLRKFIRPDNDYSLSIEYAGLEKTIREITTDGSGFTKKQVYDVFSRMVEIREFELNTATAVTRYEYDGNDNLTRIIDAENNVTKLIHDWVGNRTAISRGERTWQYAYDRNDNLREEIKPHPDDADPANFTTVHEYDDLDRVESVSFIDLQGNSTHHYFYDSGRNSTGRLVKVELPFGEIRYGYDARGLNREEQRSVTINSNIIASQAVQRGYNALGLPTLNTWDDGQQWRTSYDQRGMVDTVEWHDSQTNTWQKVADYTRSVAGQPRRRDSSFSQTRIFSYDVLGRPVVDIILSPGHPQNSPISSRTYVYTDSGDLRSVSGVTGETSAVASIGYDSLHRVHTVSGPNGYNGSFTYSPTGNILTAHVTWNDSPDPRHVRYEYGARDPQAVDRLVNVSDDASYAAFDYDVAGNMIQRITPEGTWMLKWNGLNQIRSIQSPNGSESYYYDHDGTRIMAVNDKGARFWFAERETHFDQTGTQILSYLHLSGEGSDLARIQNGTELELQYADAREDLILSLDPEGNVTASFLLGPFGEVLSAVGETQHRRQFNGKENDAITGLQYYGVRYYDPLVARWISSDPQYRFAPDLAVFEPQRLNLYAFSLNNALRYVDPDGRSPEDTGLLGRLSRAAQSTTARLLDFAVKVLEAVSNPTGGLSAPISGSKGLHTRGPEAERVLLESAYAERTGAVIDREISRQFAEHVRLNKLRQRVGLDPKQFRPGGRPPGPTPPPHGYKGPEPSSGPKGRLNSGIGGLVSGLQILLDIIDETVRDENAAREGKVRIPHRSFCTPGEPCLFYEYVPREEVKNRCPPNCDI